MKRVKGKEVVIFQTDKSGRFSVDTPTNYRETAVPHIAGAPIVELGEHDELEKKMNAHSVMWMKMLNAGEENGH